MSTTGRIYKIVCNETGYIYIGCTFLFLNEVLDNHKNEYKKWLFDPFEYKYTSLFDILSNNNYEIILIEEIEDSSIDDILLKKKYYINKYKSICIN